MSPADLAAQLGCSGLAQHIAPRLHAPLAEAVAATRAAEGTVWLFDPASDALRPVANTGAQAATMIAEVRQPADEGLISMVLASGQPFCENDIAGNPDHSPRVDSLLGLQTTAMLAVPLAFADELRGVLSLVQLGTPEKQFGRADLAAASEAVAAMAKAADATLEQLLDDE